MPRPNPAGSGPQSDDRGHWPAVNTHSICGVSDGKSKMGFTGGKAGTSIAPNGSPVNQTVRSHVSRDRSGQVREPRQPGQFRSESRVSRVRSGQRAVSAGSGQVREPRQPGQVRSESRVGRVRSAGPVSRVRSGQRAASAGSGQLARSAGSGQVSWPGQPAQVRSESPVSRVRSGQLTRSD